MTRQKGRPDTFQWIPVVERPVEPMAVDGAIATFVEHFVVPERMERARLKLGSSLHRQEALRVLWGWLDPKRTTTLEGNTGSVHAMRLAVPSRC